MKTVLFIFFVLTTLVSSAQNWLTTGNSGLTTSNYLGTTDAKDVILKTNSIERGRVLSTGSWRFGTATNNAIIDSTGKLQFSGTGSYLVGPNKYAFQYGGNTKYGLFFNSTNVQYEFRNGNAAPVFYVNANSGNGVFTGTLKIGSYTLPSTDGLNGQVLTTNGNGVVSWSTVNGAGSGANNSLSNLNTITAINSSLLPGSDNTIDLGSSNQSFRDIYFKGGLYNGANLVLKIDTSKSNIALGPLSLFSNTTGNGNISLGAEAAYNNTTGYSNVVIGVGALHNNIDGHNVVAIGDSALFNQTVDGDDIYGNTAIGSKALFSITNGEVNTGVGFKALYTSTAGAANTAVGAFALYSDGGSINNTAIGSGALNSNTNADENTAVGADVLLSNTTGTQNTAIGSQAMQFESTGSQNTAVGFYAGSNTDVAYLNAMALGHLATMNASNKVVVGDNHVTVIGGTVGWSIVSDSNFKSNIKENVPGLIFINKLKPVTYNLKLKKFDKFLGIKDSLINTMESEYAVGEKKIHTGFIAQDVERIAKSINYDFDGVNHPQSNKDNYSLVYADFVPSIVKSIQELSTQNDSLKNEIANQKNINAQLEDRLSKIEALLNTQNASANDLQKVDLNTASLSQNVPNPFNGKTTISYYLPKSTSSAIIKVTDITGKLIKSFTVASKGSGQVILNSNELSTGTYYYSLLVNGNIVDSKKMVIQ